MVSFLALIVVEILFFYKKDCNGKQELHLKNAIGLASNLFDKYKNKKATSERK